MEDANFSLARGTTLGLVGESGSGKTVSALAIMGLLPAKVSRVTGSIRFEQHELTTLSPAGLRKLRGNEIAMIFQEPMTSLNPAYTVGNQIAEQVRAHRDISRADAWKVAIEMLDRVEIPHAASRAEDYPHAFSGGMRQRVMIAMALSCSPKLLIADEPTTALDVTTQAQIIELLHTLQREEDMAMIFVTHDLGVIADVADDVVVMYAGQIVEQAAAADLFARPRHPYTEALLDSIPQLSPKGEPLHAIPGMVPRPDQFPSRLSLRCRAAPTRWRRARRRPCPCARACRDGTTADAAGNGVERCHAGSLCPAGRADLVRSRRPDRQHPDTERREWDRHLRSRPAPVLEVTDLVKDFPLRSGVLRRVTGSVQGGRPGQPAGRRRDDPGSGGRERLGKVHPGPAGAPPHRPDRRARSSSMARTSPRCAARRSAGTARRCRWSSRTRIRRSTRNRASPTSSGSPWPSTPP